MSWSSSSFFSWFKNIPLTKIPRRNLIDRRELTNRLIAANLRPNQSRVRTLPRYHALLRSATLTCSAAFTLSVYTYRCVYTFRSAFIRASTRIQERFFYTLLTKPGASCASHYKEWDQSTTMAVLASLKCLPSYCTIASVKELTKWRAVLWRQESDKYHNHMFFRILFSCSIACSIQCIRFQTPSLDSYSANDLSVLNA